MRSVVVTGSSGLIGSEAVAYFAPRCMNVIGVDNNMRRDYFGPEADTAGIARRLASKFRNFTQFSIDVRERQAIMNMIANASPELIIHAAAQPSHDLSARRPLDDFDVNAVGTLNVLEAARRVRDVGIVDPVVCFTSSSKVYGDAPNEIPLVELTTRFDYASDGPGWTAAEGITEEFRLDRSMHSPFGAGKVAADIMAQEYGRYFGLKVGVFRGSCLTGRSHRGVPLHGFLSHLFAVARSGGTYTVVGYAGRQVRDNIHSLDCVRAFDAFRKDPRPGEVYNLAGGRGNSCSVLEAVEAARGLGLQFEVAFDDRPRKGDHMCYIGDNAKFRNHYPGWSVGMSLWDIYRDLAEPP